MLPTCPLPCHGILTAPKWFCTYAFLTSRFFLIACWRFKVAVNPNCTEFSRNEIRNHSHLTHFLQENVPYTVCHIECRYRKHRDKSSHLLSAYWVVTDCLLIVCLWMERFLIYNYSHYHQIKLKLPIDIASFIGPLSS